MVPPPVSVAVSWLPLPLEQIDWDPEGLKATEERSAVTVTVTSFETVALPHVGVEVQTTYQVPAPKPAPVGV